MGSLEDEMDLQRAKLQEQDVTLPFGRGMEPYVPKPLFYQMPAGHPGEELSTSEGFGPLFEDFCQRLRPTDGAPAVLVRDRDGVPMIYEIPLKIRSFEFAGDPRRREFVQANRDRIRWLRRSDLGGARLLKIYDYDGTLEFGYVDGVWFPLGGSATPNRNAKSILASWLISNGIS